MIPFHKKQTRISIDQELLEEAEGFFQKTLESPIVGASLYDLKQKALKMAQLPHAVLIRGESGTGKELFAKYLHQESKNPRNMVSINCGAIPSHLIYSELFGCTAHAFTGASQRNGLILKAHMSTLFLDEIGELSFEAQSSLLRVLEQKEVLPLGAEIPKKVDFRLICATHRNLEQMVAQGRFREDLYHRISVLHLEIPPLRQRVSDLTELIYRLNPQVAQKLTQDAWHKLKQYPWPGNIRELKNTLIRLEVASDRSLIHGHEIVFLSAFNKTMVPQNIIDDASLKDKITQYIRQTFELHGKNVKQTAQALSISKNTVYRYIGVDEDHLDDTLPPKSLIDSAMS